MLDCPLQLQCICFYTNVLTILNGNNSKVQLPACLLPEEVEEAIEEEERRRRLEEVEEEKRSRRRGW